jgi:hypothetical protein
MEKIISQKLLWIPEGKDVGATHKKCVVKYTGKVPYRVWALPSFRKKEDKPQLPYSPVHHKNSFLEDKMHDWHIVQDKFLYHGCMATEGSVWLLLEFI